MFEKDDFDPNELVGEEILFQCITCKEPTVVKLISIKKHYKCLTMHVGKNDLVVYETQKGHASDNEFPMKRPCIVALLENGYYEKNGAKYLILVDASINQKK